jgi:hypothetical protein
MHCTCDIPFASFKTQLETPTRQPPNQQTAYRKPTNASTPHSTTPSTPQDEVWGGTNSKRS